jgi:hypothetical protein
MPLTLSCCLRAACATPPTPRLQHAHSRNGTRILANKLQVPQNQELSKRRRTDAVIKYLRPLVAASPHPAPGPEPETLWAMAANLLFIPLESKQRQRDQQDDVRRGPPRPTPGSKAEPEGGDAAAAAAAGSTPASRAPSPAAAGGAAAAASPAAGDAAAGAAAAAAAAPAAGLASPTAQQQQQAGAAGLPPPGPNAARDKHATTIANQLRDRQHLFKLPDAIASNMYSWRCSIGRGGRARLECIDHVTQQSFNTLKAEMQAVHQHYQVGTGFGGKGVGAASARACAPPASTTTHHSPHHARYNTDGAVAADAHRTAAA